MKKILSRISIIALVLIMTMSITIPAFAAEGSTDESNALDYFNSLTRQQKLDFFKSRFNPGWEYIVGFRTGHFGDAESTGVLGVEGGGFCVPSLDTVKWTLKDSVLHIYGTGNTRDGNTISAYHNSPFANNPHIKTVIVTGNVVFNTALVKDAPNLETIILVDAPAVGNLGTSDKHSVNIITYGDTVSSSAFYGTTVGFYGNTVYHVVNNLTVDQGSMAYADKKTTYAYVPNDITVSAEERLDDPNDPSKMVDMVVPAIVNGEVIVEYTPLGYIRRRNVYDWCNSDVGRVGLRYSRDELAVMAANIIADIDLPDWALALIPGELGGTAPAAQTPAQPAVQFTDVPADKYYAQPVQWAVEQGITSGTSSTTFSPDATCTNAHTLTLDHPYRTELRGGLDGPDFSFLAPDLTETARKYDELLGSMDVLAQNLMKLFAPNAPVQKMDSTGTQPIQAAPAPAASADAVAEIQRFKDLMDQGILTEEEFTAKKRQLLGI